MKRRLDPRTIEVVDEIMWPILRGKTPAERIAMVGAAQRTARLLVAGEVRLFHPDWSEAQVSAEVARRMTRGTA